MLIDLIWILKTRFDPYFVVGQTSIRGIAHWTMNVIETHTHSPRSMFSGRFAFYLRSEMNQYHFSYFIFFKPYWMDSGNIQRRNEFGRCKQFLLKFWLQMSPIISIFSLVKKQSCKKAFTPRLPTDEATKLIHDDTSDDRKMRYAVRLSIFTCHEFVVRQLSFFTRTVSLTEISTKHPQEELWNVIANCQLIPTRWSKCLEHLLVLSWPYAVIFSQEQGKNFSS